MQLPGVQEHAAHSNRIPHSTLPAYQAGRGAPARTGLEVWGGEVAHSETHQCVVRIEKGDHNLSGLTPGKVPVCVYVPDLN